MNKKLCDICNREIDGLMYVPIRTPGTLIVPADVCIRCMEDGIELVEKDTKILGLTYKYFVDKKECGYCD